MDKKKPQNSDEIEISLEEDDIDLLNSTLDQVHLGNDNFAKSVNDYQASIVSGFQLAVASGPLCGEPMSGVCFAIQDAKFFIDENTESKL